MSKPDNILDWGEGVLPILWRLFTERSLPWNFYTLTQVSDKIDLAKFYKSNKVSKEKSITSDKKNNLVKNKKEKEINKNINIFETFKNVNAAFELKAKKFVYENILLKNVAINAKKKKNISVFLKGQNFFNGTLNSKFVLADNMNFSFDANLRNLSLMSLNKYYGVDLASGNINLTSNLKGKIEKEKKIYQSLYGKSSISSKKIILKNFNLKALRQDIRELDYLAKINNARKALFNGNTNINDQEINLVHDKENIIVPITKINIEDGLIQTSGKYNINKNYLNLISNYDSDSNKLLSLFNLQTTGKISKPITKIVFDEGAVMSVLEKVAEKKLKKIIEKKLEKKFDNILNELLD